MNAFLDTNIIIRHLTGEPADMAVRATNLLAEADELLLSDVVVAEVVYVLEWCYDLSRAEIVALLQTVIGFPSVVVLDARLLLRALAIYELHRVHFADAYLVASAEATGVGVVASFDRDIDRVASVTRLEPPAS